MLRALADVHSLLRVLEYANARKSWWAQLVLTGMSRPAVTTVPANT